MTFYLDDVIEEPINGAASMESPAPANTENTENKDETSTINANNEANCEVPPTVVHSETSAVLQPGDTGDSKDPDKDNVQSEVTDSMDTVDNISDRINANQSPMDVKASEQLSPSVSHESAEPTPDRTVVEQTHSFSTNTQHTTDSQNAADGTDGALPSLPGLNLAEQSSQDTNGVVLGDDNPGDANSKDNNPDDGKVNSEDNTGLHDSVELENPSGSPEEHSGEPSDDVMDVDEAGSSPVQADNNGEQTIPGLLPEVRLSTLISFVTTIHEVIIARFY